MTRELHELILICRSKIDISGQQIRDKTGLSTSRISYWARKPLQSSYNFSPGDHEKAEKLRALMAENGVRIAQDERTVEHTQSSRVEGELDSWGDSESLPAPEHLPAPEPPEPAPMPFFQERHGKPFYDAVFEDARESMLSRVREHQQSVTRRKRLSIRRTHYREAVLSDIQIPFQDDLALEITFDLLKEYNPDLIYLLGDVNDLHALSRWTTDPTRKSFYLEREMVRDFLRRLREAHPGSKIKWMEGNHEHRLRSEMYRSEKLADLMHGELSFEALYSLRELNIEYVTQIDRIGKLFHLHGHENYTRGQVVHVALRNLRYLKRSSICGHWHRFQWFPEREIDGSWQAGFVNGCLFDVKKMPGGGYSAVDTGQRGISLVDYDSAGNYRVTPVPYIETGQGYSVWFDNQFYDYYLAEEVNQAA